MQGLGGKYQLFVGGQGGTGTYSSYGFYLHSEPVENVGKIRTNFQSVPYFDGDYDFTRMDGRAHFDGTDLTYTFQRFTTLDRDPNAIEGAAREFMRWLSGLANRTLYDDWSGKTFTNCTCTGVEPEYSGNGYIVNVTATFHSTVSTADGAVDTSYYDYDTETLTAGSWSYIEGSETAVWVDD